MQLTTLISTSNNGNCCFPKGAVNQGGGHNPIPQKQEEREFLKSLAPPLMVAGATLFTKDLQRNGIDTEEEIYRVTYFGNGRMPGFDEKCAPRGPCTFGARLQDEEIKILAEFVKLQADQNWPNIVVADSSFR
ncbi:unnamed protein product [Malus baccata var. baccata]